MVRKVSLEILEHREMKNCPVKFSEKDKKEDVLWLHDVYVYPVYAQDEGPPKALRPHFKKGFTAQSSRVKPRFHGSVSLMNPLCSLGQSF